MSDIRKRIYQSFSLSPLQAEDEALYVDLDDVRGKADVVNRLAKRILLSAEATCQLLAGHHGSGKSTELHRLQRRLETADPPCFVVFCESDKDVDRNDVDFPDVLIAVVRQMAAQLKEKAQITLGPGFFKHRWEKMTKWLGTEVDLEKLPLDVGLGNISKALKSSPDAREEIRQLLDPDTSNLLYAANDLIGVAKQELLKQGIHDLVILVDDLDKMVLREHAVAGCSTAEYMFVHRHGQLSGFKCHVVYTMPLALAYSAQEQQISNLYGGRPPVVSMTKIATCPPWSKDFQPGIRKLREVIAARLRKGEAKEEEVFADGKVRDRLIKLSGGQPRELMILMREAIITDDLPISNAAVDRAFREGRRAYARQLREEHQPILEQVRRNGALKRTKANDELVRELLDSRAILQYVNDKEWYGVNPLISYQPAPAARKKVAKKTKKKKKTAKKAGGSAGRVKSRKR